MEVNPEIVYKIEKHPQPHKFGTVELHTIFMCPVDIEPIMTRSRFSCLLPAKEFIEDDGSPRKQDLYDFLTESGVDEHDAITLMLNLIRSADLVVSSLEYCTHYALSMWLYLEVDPLSQEDDPELEEVIQTSLADDTSFKFTPASKLGVKSLSRRKFKRKPKASISKANRTSKCIVDPCTICLNTIRTGRIVGTLPCGHEFHNKCIVEWLNVSHFCPLCRYELPWEDDQHIEITI